MFGKIFSYERNPSVTPTPCTAADRRCKKLERKQNVKLGKRIRNFKRRVEAKHGRLAVFLYEPWLLQIILCVHWSLTWWVSLALHTNATAMLEERFAREITQLWNESFAPQTRLRSRRCISKVQRNAELQRWLQRKKARRDHARNLTNNVC